MAKTSWGAGGWGIQILGYRALLDLLENLQTRFEGGTAYLVGPTVEYAVYQEFGTSSQPARPFMRPALDRVRTNTAAEVKRVASSQGIRLDGEEPIVRCAALAVEDHAKRIADAKEIRDTGTLINSIEARKV